MLLKEIWGQYKIVGIKWDGISLRFKSDFIWTFRLFSLESLWSCGQIVFLVFHVLASGLYFSLPYLVAMTTHLLGWVKESSTQPAAVQFYLRSWGSLLHFPSQFGIWERPSREQTQANQNNCSSTLQQCPLNFPLERWRSQYVGNISIAPYLGQCSL